MFELQKKTFYRIGPSTQTTLEPCCQPHKIQIYKFSQIKCDKLDHFSIIAPFKDLVYYLVYPCLKLNLYFLLMLVLPNLYTCYSIFFIQYINETS